MTLASLRVYSQRGNPFECLNNNAPTHTTMYNIQLYSDKIAAAQRFIEEHGFDNVLHTSYVTTEENSPKFLASVTFPGVMSGVIGASEIFSDHIDTWGIPAHEVFDCYLRGKQFDVSLYKAMLK